MTLKGPSTLFYKFPEDAKDSFKNIINSKDHSSMKSKREIAKLVDEAKIHRAPKHLGTLYIVGNIDKAAVHSEPPMDSDRVFISVLPGTQKQIQEWEQRCCGDNI